MPDLNTAYAKSKKHLSNPNQHKLTLAYKLTTITNGVCSN